ncbi:hypothetical protein HPB50_002872 [Hyalomma asiaticum]|uniref:Uncharacterized protein n=1 Tax=Hyalomma asiaticum TaxID=266040 RepID=A0ACB7SBM5_HYAAI|nr:hypothetical protein HPB50_002872 [Hyalomma asiaticum]
MNNRGESVVTGVKAAGARIYVLDLGSGANMPHARVPERRPTMATVRGGRNFLSAKRADAPRIGTSDGGTGVCWHALHTPRSHPAVYRGFHACRVSTTSGAATLGATSSALMPPAGLDPCFSWPPNYRSVAKPTGCLCGAREASRSFQSSPERELAGGARPMR